MNKSYPESPEAKLVCAIAKGILVNDRRHVSELLQRAAFDWAALHQWLTYHNLAPFAWQFLRHDAALLPADIAQSLKASHDYYLVYSSFLVQQFLKLHEAFEQAGITFVPLKGVALLDDLYRHFPMRPSTDIDVLVARSDLDTAADILGTFGYRLDLEGLARSYWDRHHYHVVFSKQGEDVFPPPLVEVHWALDYPRRNTRVLPEVLNRLRNVRVQDRCVSMLSPEDTVLATALQQRRFGMPLALKESLDLAMVIQAHRDVFDWEYLIAESMRSHMRSTLYFAFFQAVRYLDMRIPDGVLERLRVSRFKQRMIRGFIERHSFSRDQASRVKPLYYKTHLLLYDALLEPWHYIVTIPLEQFAKYYDLEPYARRTAVLYRLRLWYMVWRLFRRRRQEAVMRQGSEGLMLWELTGMSMWPFLVPQVKVVVKKVPPGRIRRGDCIVFTHAAQPVCHRVLKIRTVGSGYQFITRGDNAAGCEAVLDTEYIGKAVAYYRKGKIRTLTGAGQRMISRAIIVLAPLISCVIRGLNKAYEAGLYRYPFCAYCRARVRSLFS